MKLGSLIELLGNNRGLVLHACRWNNNQYSKLTPPISLDIKDELMRIALDNLEKHKDTIQKEYNPAGAIDGTIEYTSVGEYNDSVNTLLEALKQPSSGALVPLETDFLVYEILLENKSVYAVRMYNKLRGIRKGFFANFFGDKYEEIDDVKVLAVDAKIDFFIYDNEIIIFSHNSFERAFKLNKEFIERAEKVLDNEIFKTSITNFVELKDDLLKNMSYVKRISKLTDNNTSVLFINKIERTKEVSERFNLGLTFQGKNIVYESKEQLGEFVNLMQDAYYLTLIGETEGVNERG